VANFLNRNGQKTENRKHNNENIEHIGIAVKTSKKPIRPTKPFWAVSITKPKKWKVRE
jgi:hypothetical protein